jgi:hypothetical protein
MNLDDLESEVLATVRRDLTPSGDTATRALSAVLSRIATTPLLPAPVNPTAGPSLVQAHLGATTAFGKAVWAVALVTTGFVAGWGSHVVVSRPEAPARVAPATVSGARDKTREASGNAAAPARKTKEPELTTEAPEALPPPVRKEAPNRVKAAEPASSSAEQRLLEEVRLLRDVDRALRTNDPGTALELLNELERRVPGGKLREEREAARRLGECLGRPGTGTRETARSFLRAHPSTVYSGRIREVCGIGPDP